MICQPFRHCASFRFSKCAQRAQLALYPLALLSLSLSLFTLAAPLAAPAHADEPAASQVAAYTSAHMYLYNAACEATDVTNSYVATGTVFDASSGCMEQTGYVVDTDGNRINVVVNFTQGEIENWSHKLIGFIAR